MSKNVLITGGSSGIGMACVKLFAKMGYNVYFSYFNGKSAAEALCEELKAFNVKCFKCDVSVRKEVEELFDVFSKELGDIDVLINNAGIAQQKLFCDITEEDWDRMFDVNLKGVFNTCQCALKSMTQNKNGSIVNVSSMWGVSGASCEAHYSAAKAAVISLTKSLAKEYGLMNIRVNAVAPGVIDTRMNAHLAPDAMKELAEQISLSRIGTPEEAAEVIYFVASEKASYVTGQVITCDGGFI